MQQATTDNNARLNALGMPEVMYNAAVDATIADINDPHNVAFQNMRQVSSGTEACSIKVWVSDSQAVTVAAAEGACGQWCRPCQGFRELCCLHMIATPTSFPGCML